jgi:5-methyltetrahydrofolate--homocysteine methyltransferase
MEDILMDQALAPIYQGVLEGDVSAVTAGVEQALGVGVAAETLLNMGLIPAMAEVGRLFESGEYYVPDMLISARAMQAGLAILKPQLASANVQSAGKVAIGTVKGDLHDIGKNLVGMMLEGAGFEVKDLGVDVAPEKFVEIVQNDGVHIVALSALLTTTMQNMKVTIEALHAAGVRDKVKVMIGGAPLTAAYAQHIGADGYSPDASRAVSVAKSLMSSA